MSPTSRQHPSIRQRSWARVLTRGPRVVASHSARTAVTVLILAGAVLTVISGVIHLYLWGEANGYRQISVIGPLFLAQGIAAVVIGLATAVTRRLIVVLAAAGTLAATAAGLVITIEHGLFGFRESWGAPYARTSLYEEIAGAVLLLIAAWALARPHTSDPLPG
jgi:hypothetical protein